MMTSTIVNLTKDNFTSETKDVDVPILIDFWAEYCGPCKTLSPVLDEVAEELGDSVKIAKVDVMTQRLLAAEFSVRLLPTLVFMKNGEIKETKTGVMMKGAIIDKLNSL